jgi:predicted alpha/beta-hydrolase family hydrolase
VGQLRLLAMLRHGDRRSIGRADEVASAVLRRRALVELMEADRTLHPLVRRQLWRALVRGSPSERARARRLLASGMV